MLRKHRRKALVPEFKCAANITMPLPTHIQIEPVFKCNLRCSHCFRSFYKRECTSLDPDKFKSLIEQLPSLEAIKLQGLGETLLYKHLEEVLQAGTARGIQFETISNGILISKENVDFLLYYFSVFYVSIDSINPEKFGKIRGGSSLEKVLKNLELLLEKKDKYNAAIGVNFVATHENYDEIPKINGFLEKYKVDIFSIVEVENWFFPAQKGYEENKKYINEARKFSSQIRNYAAELSSFCENRGVDFFFVDSRRRRLWCPWPYYIAIVTCDGTLIPCCLRADTELSGLGNVFESDFKDLWNGEAMKEFRAALLQNRPSLSCDICPD